MSLNLHNSLIGTKYIINLVYKYPHNRKYSAEYWFKQVESYFLNINENLKSINYYIKPFYGKNDFKNTQFGWRVKFPLKLSKIVKILLF